MNLNKSMFGLHHRKYGGIFARSLVNDFFQMLYSAMEPIEITPMDYNPM